MGQRTHRERRFTVVVEDEGVRWPLWLMSRLLSSVSFLGSKNKRSFGSHLGEVCSTQFILIGPIDLVWLCVRGQTVTIPLSH